MMIVAASTTLVLSTFHSFANVWDTPSSSVSISLDCSGCYILSILKSIAKNPLSTDLISVDGTGLNKHACMYAIFLPLLSSNHLSWWFVVVPLPPCFMPSTRYSCHQSPHPSPSPSDLLPKVRFVELAIPPLLLSYSCQSPRPCLLRIAPGTLHHTSFQQRVKHV